MEKKTKKSSLKTARPKRGTRSATKTDHLDSEAERRRKIEDQLRLRVDLEEKAFRIVEKMLDNPISEDFLLESVLHLQPSHYDDIVEERAIALMCGYPVCLKSLTNVPKQKYHISTKSNRVYDISTRKNFCSNKCFEASEYLKGQLMTSPLWMREEEPKPRIQLISRDSTSGSVGHEVITSSVAMKKELEALQRRDKYEERLKSKQASPSDSVSDPDHLSMEGLTLGEKKTDATNSNDCNRSHDQVNSQSDSKISALGKSSNVDEDVSRNIQISENLNTDSTVISSTCDRKSQSDVTELHAGNIADGSKLTELHAGNIADGSKLTEQHAGNIADGSKLTEQHAGNIADGSKLTEQHAGNIADGSKLTEQHAGNIADGSKLTELHAGNIADGSKLTEQHAGNIADGSKLTEQHAGNIADGSKLTELHAGNIADGSKLTELHAGNIADGSKLTELHAGNIADGSKLTEQHAGNIADGSKLTEQHYGNSTDKCDGNNLQTISPEKEKLETTQNIQQDATQTDQMPQTQPKLEEMSSQSKVDYLMKLLDKKKHLLSKMADIQPTDTKQITVSSNIQPTDHPNKKCDIDKSQGRSGVKGQEVEHMRLSDNQQSDQTSESVQSQDRSQVKNQETGQLKSSQNKEESPRSTCSPGFLMCQCLKQWITKETKQYLLRDNDKNSAGLPGIGKQQFEDKYRELCRRVDAKENDLDAMIDETGMDDPSMSCKPLPHYRELKAEAEEFSNRVEQFMQGKLVMEVKEKEEDSKTPVYLPTVDTYDQMLIRRNIVMDKLNKAMPELLAPLCLSVQSIFTDLKNLISTFRFSNQNILFKPAQWTLISIVLLKILARKHLHIAAAFDQPSAQNYFKVLLGGIGETTQTMSVYVDNLLSK